MKLFTIKLLARTIIIYLYLTKYLWNRHRSCWHWITYSCGGRPECNNLSSDGITISVCFSLSLHLFTCPKLILNIPLSNNIISRIYLSISTNLFWSDAITIYQILFYYFANICSSVDIAYIFGIILFGLNGFIFRISWMCFPMGKMTSTLLYW